jgi:hypothetical protein
MPANDSHLVDKPRPEITAMEYFVSENTGPIIQIDYERTRFRFVAAKKVHFRGVSFMYCVFEDCYFRDCRFEDCNFTGATFRNSNLRGSNFDGSRFDYCRFSHTLVPASIIERHMPGYENVALELARSLRVNYAQVGDTDGVNKAISAELDATRIHLKKAAWSKESYYRNKHKGLNRIAKILEYCWFRFLDLLWGNGESLPKLLRTIVIAYALIAVFLYSHKPGASFFTALGDAFLAFWGSYVPATPMPSFAAIALTIRTVFVGLFVTVLVRRLSRR